MFAVTFTGYGAAGFELKFDKDCGVPHVFFGIMLIFGIVNVFISAGLLKGWILVRHYLLCFVGNRKDSCVLASGLAALHHGVD